jgi:hypothetical protein
MIHIYGGGYLSAQSPVLQGIQCLFWNPNTRDVDTGFRVYLTTRCPR